MAIQNIDIVKALDRIRINNLYVHNAELAGAKFVTPKLENRRVYLVETLAVLNAIVDRGTMLLYGGHGGGKTTLSKYLGQIFCHLSKDQIEDCILRGHPQLTEEKILGNLDFAELTGNKDLTDGKIDVVWNEFVKSEWKIIDEVNRISPYAQNILLSLLAESTVKYQNQALSVPKFSLYATMNPKDEGNTTLSLPFLDRFAIALPMTMPDYDSFSTIGKKDKSMRSDDLSSYLPSFNLNEAQEQVRAITYTEEAELFINFIIASYRICERISKESNESITVDKNLCDGCHMNAPQKVCNKIKQPLSVRVKEDLYRYGKALAWFLGYTEVSTEHISILAPFMIWHRSRLSKKYMTGKINSIKGDDSDEPVFITNPDLDATADIIALIRSEFEGVKSDLKVFEKIKKGKLTKNEFEDFILRLEDPANNFLIIKSEILPTLKSKYEPVYDQIIDYRNNIDADSDNDMLKRLKDKLSYEYNIPNRQYLSELIDTKIRQQSFIEDHFELDIDKIKASEPLTVLIRKRLQDFPQTEPQKLKTIQLLDIADDYCSLYLYRTNRGYQISYQGNKNDPVYEMLKDATS